MKTFKTLFVLTALAMVSSCSRSVAANGHESARTPGSQDTEMGRTTGNDSISDHTLTPVQQPLVQPPRETQPQTADSDEQKVRQPSSARKQ